MNHDVTHQVKLAIMSQLYRHTTFSLPCLGLLALGWSLLFHDFLPTDAALEWLTVVLLVLLCRAIHLRSRLPRLNQLPLLQLEREMLIGVSCTSVTYAFGVLLYMDALPDTYRAAMMMLASMILTGSAIMLFGCRILVYGALLPLGVAMIYVLAVGNEQEQLVASILAGYLFLFLPTLLRRLQRDQIASFHLCFSNAELVTELKVVSEHLRLASRLDGLTGIANRAHLDESLVQAWQCCHHARSPLSLVLIDVDYFKQFNDTYGHQMGDDCLQQVAALLAESVRREGDLAARYGGEEFVLLLPCSETQEALQVAEEVRAALYDLAIPHQSSRVARQVTCSFGIATLVPDGGIDMADLIQKADAALYQAKHNGRDRIEVALQDQDKAA